MKKLSLALITGGALCAFGVLLGGAALAMTSFEFSKVVTVSYTHLTLPTICSV